MRETRNPDYITLREVAEQVGFSIPTVRRLAEDHRVGLWKLAGQRYTYILREDVPKLMVPVARLTPWTDDDREEAD